MPNWNRDPNQGAKRETQPTLMGEGLGFNLGIDNPKHVAGKPLGYYEQQEILRRREKSEKRAKKSVVKARNRLVEFKYNSFHLPKKIENGEVLINQRIFLVEWPKEKWEAIAKNVGLPEGTDVALTEFGELLIVPVIEKSDAAKLGIDPKETKPLKDVEGRPCWVAQEVREKIEMIFGRVRWTRPLTIREAEQFGVKL